MPIIKVKHNVEMAHRLTLTPGRCENIHGHSWWVTLMIKGSVDETGKVAGLEYGDVKRWFRQYLDTEFDHHLVLNTSDPIGNALFKLNQCRFIEDDPTTENFALLLYRWAKAGFPDLDIKIEVWETAVNAAEVGDW